MPLLAATTPAYGLIAYTSVFLALLAACCTAWLAWKTPLPFLNGAKKAAGSPVLFMAVVFSLFLLLEGYLFRTLLFKILLPLALYGVLMLSFALYGLFAPRIKRMFLNNQSPAWAIILSAIISLLSASAFIILIMGLLNLLFSQ